MTILDYYKYAQLATAAYVRAGGLDLGSSTYGQDFAQLANDQSEGRLPLSIAQYLFAPNQSYPNVNPWFIRHYYGGDNTNDPIASNDHSGFAATLFQQGENREKVLAIRGTEPDQDYLAPFVSVDLFSADLGQIGALGIALSQTVSMVNLIERLRVTEGESARQINLSVLNELPSLIPGARYVRAHGVLGASVYFVFSPGEASGLGVIAPGEKISVTGHSLSGELAVLAALLFPETVNSDVTIFNSAGINPDPADYDAFQKNVLLSLKLLSPAISAALIFDLGPAAGSLALEAQQLASPLLGALMGTLLGLPVDWNWGERFDFSNSATAFPGLTIHNLRGEDIAPGNDLDMVASDLTGADIYPAHTDIAVEPNSHVMEPLMDALALHAALGSMNNALTLADSRDLILASAAADNVSEESLTNGLFKLLLPDEKYLTRRDPSDRSPINGSDRLPISDAIGPIDNSFWIRKGDIAARDAFHDAVLGIQTKIRNSAIPLSLESLVDATASEIFLAATNPDVTSISAIAHRYALKELNPFAIVGADYAPHNQNGELDPYDPVARTGSLTTRWIEDRANFLFWKNVAYTIDTNFVAYPNAPKAQFNDLSLDIKIAVQSIESTLPVTDVLPVYMFGGDSTDSLVGADSNDRLYGAAGTDVLRGKEGDDYLEGGRGVDVYFYRVDEFLIDEDDGKDTILDIDGLGIVHLWHRRGLATLESAVAADASVQISATQWQSADGRFTYTLREGEAGRADLEITIAGGSGGSLRVKDFRNGDLFIDLWSARPALTFGDATNAILGTDLGDNIVGTAANDQIETHAGVDLVHAGDGDDLVRGGDDADFLFGETGRDRLYGESGRDQLYGGAEDDALFGGSGEDIVEGGSGNDQLSGESGSDILIGDAGDDTLYASAFRTLVEAILLGESEPSAGTRGDWLDGGDGDDVLIGAAEHDVLLGGGGKDVIVGGAGDDTIRGDTGRDSVSLEWSVERGTVLSDFGLIYQAVFANALVSRSAEGAGDRIYGGAGADWIFGEAGNDFIDGGSDKDFLFGGEGDDAILGGDGDDLLIGDNPGVVAEADEGSDYLDGGAGADTLYGNGGDDILVGGRGNDHLHGGAGKDIYLFSRRDGFDIIYDVAPAEKTSDASVVIFVDDTIARGQVIFRPGSLIIDLGLSDPDDPTSPRDMIRFADFNVLDPYSTRVLSVIQFANGDSMSFEEVLAQGFDIDGTEGDDDGISNPVLVGTAVTDRIRGFGGNDELQGLDGDDVLDGGAGNDRLFGGAGDDELFGGEGADQLIGDAGSDRLFGGAGRDALWGGAGDDWLAGGADFDRLFGGAGNDTYLFDEQDTVFDVEGDTYIDLGPTLEAEDLELRRLVINGQVVYQLRRSVAAGGQAFAEGMGITVGSEERLAGFVLGDGSVLDREQMLRAALADGRVLIGTDDDDLLEGYGGNDSLQGGAGADTLSGYRGNDRLEGDSGDDWLEGGSGNDLLIGGDGADVLIGGTGDDYLSGGVGADTYVFGRDAGYDTISDQGDPDSIDTILIDADVAPGEVSLARRPNGDLSLTIAGADGELVVAGYYLNPANRIERIVFGDGTEIGVDVLDALSVPPIAGTDGNDVLSGTEFDDTLIAAAGDDQLIGGAGDDLLIGGAGVDTYWLSPGGGLDRAVEDGADASFIRLGSGLRLNDLRTLRSGDDLQLLIRGTGDGLIVQDYYAGNDNWTVVTASGQSQDLPSLIDYLASIGGIASVAQASQRYLDAARIAFLAELAGFGASGDIRINEQTGDDAVIYRDAPFDVTVEGGLYYLNIARILAGPSANMLDFRYSGAIVADAGAGDDFLYAYGWGYSDTGDFLYGNSGDDRIVGTFNNDVIAGGSGNDYLGGTDGNDTYLFFYEDEGFDIVDEAIPDLTLPGGYYTFAGGRNSTDTVEFGEGIAFDALEVSYGTLDSGSLDGGATSKLYDALDIGWAAGRGVRVVLPDTSDPYIAGTMANFPGESFGVERFRFADGSEYSIADFLFLADHPRRIVGTAAADSLFGDERNNELLGLDGDDFLSGGLGDDLLDGGPGNDFLFDLGGSDTYYFARGYGQDQISNNDSGPDDFDTLLFGPDISPADVSVHIGDRFSVGIVFSLNGGDDRVTVGGWLATAPWNNLLVEQVRFDDGTVWDVDAILERLVRPGASDGDDVLVGMRGSDEIHGLAGDDAIYGLDGDDMLRGGAGNDYVEGGGGNDILLGEDGADDLEEWAGNNILDGGDGDDYLYAEGLPTLLIGGAGDDWIDSCGANNVVAFNVGDGADLLYAKEALTLSLGGGFSLENLVLSGMGDDLLLDLGGTDRIVLTRRYEANPGAWPTLRLQLIADDIRVYDLTAAIFAYRELAAGDPGLRLPMAAILPAHLLGISADLAYGGALAYAYAQTGVAFPDQASAIQVLTSPAFGAQLQFVPGVVSPDVDGTFAGDVLVGTGSAETLHGADGDDWLDGGAGDDTLIGGPGNDLLMGGPGADTYIYAPGDGIDTIWDPSSPEQSNTLVFADGIDSADLSLGLGSLIVRVGSAGGAIHLASFDPLNPFGPRDIDRFVFADGEVLDYEQLFARGVDIAGTAGDDLLSGTALADRIVGGAGKDVLDGLGGDDALSGGAGEDSYRFGRGYGLDRIAESGLPGEFDVVLLGDGILPGDVALSSSGTDLILDIAGGNDRLVILNWVDAAQRVEEIRFADGTRWSEAYLAAAFAGGPSYGGTLADQVTLEDLAFNYVLPPDAFAASAGGTLMLTATLADGGALPSWLSFDAGTQTFSGIPMNADVGAYALRVTASQSGAEVSGNFIITVINVNDAPYLGAAPPPLQTLEDQAFEFHLSPDLFLDDDAGDTLAVTVTGAAGTPLPQWLAFDPLTRRLSGTPGNADVGVHQLTLTATDAAGLHADTGLQIEVLNVNDAPIALVALSQASIVEGRYSVIQLQNPLFADIDAGDTLSYSARLSGQGGLPAWLSFDEGASRFIASPDGNAQGEYLIEIEARDRDGATDVSRLQLTVINVNTVNGSDDPDEMHLGADYDIVRAGNGRDRIFGGAGDDVLWGENGDDLLDGETGNDWLEGGRGNDTLYGGAGRDALSGGAGNDVLTGSTERSFLAGGSGGDLLHYRGDGVVVAINERDGHDRLVDLGGALTISVGGDFDPAGMMLARIGTDLKLSVSAESSLTIAGWYALAEKGPVTLQLFERSAGADRNIRRFDFGGWVAAFDAAGDSGAPFNAASSLNAQLLSESQTQAIGGALSYRYASLGTLEGLDSAAVQAQLAGAGFAVEPQPVQEPPAAAAGGANAVMQKSSLDPSVSAPEPTMNPTPAPLPEDGTRAVPKEKNNGALASLDMARYDTAIEWADFDSMAAQETGDSRSPSALDDAQALARAWRDMHRRLDALPAGIGDGLPPQAFAPVLALSIPGEVRELHGLSASAIARGGMQAFEGLSEGLKRLG